jgi:hypothetical protein
VYDAGTVTIWVKAKTEYGCVDSVATTIVVAPPPTIALVSGSTNQSIYDNAAIAAVKYTTTNATGVTISGHPTGVTGLWSAGVYTLTGTPTVNGTFNYTVTTTNSAGCPNASATGQIFVCRKSGATNWSKCTGFTQISNVAAERCGAVSFSTAQSLCTAKGTGWRLPTLAEAKCMHANISSVPGSLTTSHQYWVEPDKHPDWPSYPGVYKLSMSSIMAGTSNSLTKCVK